MSVQSLTTSEKPVVPILVGRNPSILDICLPYKFSAYLIATLAEVDIQALHEMMGYRPVCKGEAQKVLETLSHLLKHIDTLRHA